MQSISKECRHHMVENQLRPAGVKNEQLLESMAHVPKEKILFRNSKEFETSCYRDSFLNIDKGRYSLSPTALGLLIQACDIKPEDLVLDIGGNYGYSSCILSFLCTTVVLLENSHWVQENRVKRIQENLDHFSNGNAVLVLRDQLDKGLKEQAPYNVILISGGGVSKIPDHILRQLSPNNGRLLAIQNKTNTRSGSGVMIRRNGDQFSLNRLFDTYIPFLDGFAPEPMFSFS